MENIIEPITKNVSGIQFSIMSPEEIRKKSVVEVTKRETYEKDVPVIKGLFDTRMGTTDMGKLCTTCGLNNMKCPGHFGHIELARPVYNYHFINIVVKILKCICFRCSKLLIDKNKTIIDNIRRKPNKERWDELYEMSCKISRCGQETEYGCGCKQPDRYKVDSITGIEAHWKSIDKKQHIQAEYIKTLFEKITDEDCNLLGFSSTWCRPEWLICSVLPVPPPTVRPSVKQGGDSQRMDDDLTHKLSDILQFNNGLKKKLVTETRQEIIDDWTNQIQYHVATLIDNELPGVNQSTHRSGRPLKAIRQRLKGKEGRIRSNLMGKRVDFSGRSVITPDPNIDLDELGVPLKIAMNLTFPEKVNQFNITKLNDFIQNGNDQWPGVKNIITKNNKKISITEHNKNDISLEFGDVVNRHLIDGDYVLFNRQPSLHKMSMMGHRVKVMKIGHTFRLNVSVTPPYNADFDGDEMNVHAPQSIHSVAELINIASVNKQIISPRENKPIVTIVQDTLLGIYKLTNTEIIQYPQNSKIHYSNNTNIYHLNEDSSSNKPVEACYYTKKQMMNIICDLSTYNGSLPKSDYIINQNNNDIELWSGKCILSYIIPDNINLTMNNSMYDNNKDIKTDNITSEKQAIIENNDLMNIVNIVNGSIKSGTFDKNLFSKTSKGLIHTINNDLGNMRAHDFINDLQKIVSYILLIEGFSVGISDIIADNNTLSKINKIIDDRKIEIDEIQQEIHLNIFESFPGQSNKEFFESKVNSILNKTINETGKIGLSNLDHKNRATYMINSGSKGKLTNVAQMIACLGQQNVDGKRIPYGFTDRTLPHYFKHDDSAESRGFVVNSFISGQTPQEYFFHAMGGREGLIDTAVKTSETGYIQRQLIKAMEDCMVSHDYSVRDSSNTIVQFVYGNDGVDGTFIESQPLIITKLSDEEIHDKFYFNEKTKWSKILDKKTLEEFNLIDKDLINKSLLDSLKTILNHKNYIIQKLFNYEIQNNINSPVHIQRIVSNFTEINSKYKKKSNINPIDILKGNDDLKNKLFVNDIFKNNKILHILIDIHLNPKILISKYNIRKEQYNLISSFIIKQYNKSIISPGEMVGPIAAQSIGEPATQMTLNTFHFAGVSSKSNVTRGIPRLKELLHLSKNMKSPSTSIHLKDEYKYDKNKTRYIKNQLEYTSFKDIISSYSIHYDPNNTHQTIIDDDKEMINIYKEFLDIEYPDKDYHNHPTYNWIIRYVFDKNTMMDKGIVMEDVYLALLDYDVNKLLFVYSDDNSKELIGRVSIKIDDSSSQKINNPPSNNGIQDQTDIISTFKNINDDILNNIPIKGVKNISDIVISEKKIFVKNNKIIENKDSFFLETDGINLIDILNNEFIDPHQTISNDIIEIFEVYGIEAARNILIKEVNDVVEHASEYINSRHIQLLCDVMTSRGELISINRQGIKKTDVGPLAKCSFEDTTDQIIKASIFSEIDNLSGVTSNIMMGQIIKSGTGFSDILMDEDHLINLIKSSHQQDADDFYEINEDNIDNLLNVEDDDDDCNENSFKFSFES